MMHQLARRTGCRSLAAAAIIPILAAAVTAPLHAQQAAATSASPVPATPAGPAVGDVAPDFALVGATRYGVLRDSVRLSDFRGRTVVLAFFYKARTKG